MEGLAASVLVIAIFLVVLFIIAGLVYLLAQHLRNRPRKPANRRIGIGGIILVLLAIGLWAGLKSTSAQPAPPPPNCPAGGIWTSLQTLCNQ
jgi:threonine/homoserine/homoserine lactone efflux protein